MVGGPVLVYSSYLGELTECVTLISGAVGAMRALARMFLLSDERVSTTPVDGLGTGAIHDSCPIVLPRDREDPARSSPMVPPIKYSEFLTFLPIGHYPSRGKAGTK